MSPAARSRKLSAGGGVEERSQPDSAELIDRHALLRNVRNAVRFGQVDIPLGIRHDHVRLHHGTGAHAIGKNAVALVSDDPIASSRRVAADCQTAGLDEHHAIARVAADLVALNLRARHNAGDVKAILAISRDGFSRGRRSDQVVSSGNDRDPDVAIVLDFIPRHHVAAGRLDGHTRAAAVEDLILQSTSPSCSVPRIVL